MATAMRSHRTVGFKPNFTNPLSESPKYKIPDSRRRTPLKGILKKNDRAAMVAEPPVVVSRNLVMGQVKILKRGEVLNDESRVLKDVNSREDFADSVADREASGDRRNLPAKKQKNKKIVPSMGAHVENVSKQTKKITECFAGFIFFDSPPPSSVPLPGFLRRNLLTP